jgi:hypothetical protein
MSLLEFITRAIAIPPPPPIVNPKAYTPAELGGLSYRDLQRICKEELKISGRGKTQMLITKILAAQAVSQVDHSQTRLESAPVEVKEHAGKFPANQVHYERTAEETSRLMQFCANVNGNCYKELPMVAEGLDHMLNQEGLETSVDVVASSEGTLSEEQESAYDMMQHLLSDPALQWSDRRTAVDYLTQELCIPATDTDNIIHTLPNKGSINKKDPAQPIPGERHLPHQTTGLARPSMAGFLWLSKSQPVGCFPVI